MSAQQQPYLFYSDRCANSKQVIETLKALKKASLYKFVAVESLPRDKIPAFLKAVPTLYVPTTKDVIIGKDIYGYIAKPTNARNEVPTKEGSIGNNAPDAPIGVLSPWGFEGSGKLSESYSSWSNPTSFTAEGGSMYTFLSGASQMLATTMGGDLPGASKGTESKNTLDDKSKTGSNDDVKRRMEQMEKERETEFSQTTRK